MPPLPVCPKCRNRYHWKSSYVEYQQEEFDDEGYQKSCKYIAPTKLLRRVCAKCGTPIIDKGKPVN